LSGFYVRASAGDARRLPYQDVLKIVGKSGDYKSNVLKVNIPRNDLHVRVSEYALPTPFGYGEEVVMGDLVLTQAEVNPVMSAFLEHGFDVTALHNHFFWEEPRVFFMHIHGHGKAVELPNQIKPAIDLIGHTKAGQSGDGQKPAAEKPTLDTDRIAKIVGHAGEQNRPCVQNYGRPR
jgi:Domain of Unknown Function (DUF1259)